MASTVSYSDRSSIYDNESGVVTEVFVSQDDTGAGYSGVLTAEVVAVIEIAFGVIGVLSNLKVIIVMASDPPMLKSHTNIYMTGQSIIDAIVALCQILTSYFLNDGRYFRSLGDELYCRLWLNRIPLWAAIVASTYNMVAMTTDRYLAVVRPIWHKLHMTRNAVLVSMAVAWIFGASYQLIYKIPGTKVVKGRCLENQWASQSAGIGLSIYSSAHAFIIPVTVAVVTYAHMACKLRTSVGTVNPNAENRGSARARRNVIKTMIWVIGGYIVCWAPSQFNFILFHLGFALKRNSDYFRLLRVLLVLNCIINPFIYMFKYKAYQRALRGLIIKVTRGRCGGKEKQGGASTTKSGTSN